MIPNKAIGPSLLTPDLMAVFWSVVDTTSLDGCWPWTGPRDARGYGHFRIRRSTFRAHRISLAFATGPIPDGLYVCHRCDNPPCVRPDHLVAARPVDNVADMAAKGRRHNNAGERNANSILTAGQAEEIRKSSETNASLAAKYSVSRWTIGNIRLGKSWSEIAARPLRVVGGAK